MFVAFFEGQLMAVNPNTGQAVPMQKQRDEVIGKQFPDRDAAVRACEEHFSNLKKTLQSHTPSNELISLSTLTWQGNKGEPEIPLGVSPFPNATVYEASYTVREVA